MGLNEESVGKLEEAAAKRKARLLALKKKKTGEVQEQDQNGNSEELPTSNVLFRRFTKVKSGNMTRPMEWNERGFVDQMAKCHKENYKPICENFDESVLPPVQPAPVENLIEDQLKHAESDKQIGDVEINSLAPKKLTYDLRRGIQAQLDKLEKRTDRAIAELIRERLKEGRQQDFLMAVNVGAKVQQKQDYDSDED